MKIEIPLKQMALYQLQELRQEVESEIRRRQI